ncbi:MAG: hypothetical protein M0Q13_00170 [Methanothrix sp.]|jgi:hypothetical protein|nr:hypothetical protein [Methanothrix sp.]
MVYLKYQWPEIELAYTKGLEEDGKTKWLNKKEIAERFNVDVGYLRQVARRDNWKQKRAAYVLSLSLNEGDIEIEDPKGEYEKFQRKAYQAASQTLTIIIKKLDAIIKKQEYNLSDLNILMKMLERTQLIAKNSIGDNLENFEDAKSEFERLMKKLKEDEKTEKNLPEPLPAITVTDL